MTEQLFKTIGKEEVDILYRRFRRVVLTATANRLTSYQTGALDKAVKELIRQETQQLYRQIRNVAFSASLDNINRLQLPLSQDGNSSADHSAEELRKDPQQLYLDFRKAVLTSSANALRQQETRALQETVNILNIEIDNLSKKDFLANLHKGVVFTPNVDHLMKLQRDPDFMAAYQQADYRVCDSQILIYASKFLGRPIKAKISGSDLFPLFCEHHKDNPHIKIFLMGGKPGVAQQAQKRLNQKIGREIIVDTYTPSFGFEKNAEECADIIRAINQSSANVLVVGLGAPKQEIWITQYRPQLPKIDIFLAVGAAIDFEAGNKSRAPQMISELGLEWLYRLISEPRRLWKRYLVDDLPFLYLVLKEKFKELF